MRTRVVARLTIISSLFLGLPTEAIAQGGPRTSLPAAHRVSVTVPVIVSLLPPESGSLDQGWRIRTNDPALRRRLQNGAPVVRGVGDTLRVTVTPP